MEIRRLLTVEDQVMIHGGVPVEPATRKVAAIAVIANPFAGRHVEDLQPLIDTGAELGAILAERIVKVLGAERVQSYGKACIVGVDGEIEHSAALMHPTFGKPVREAMGGGMMCPSGGVQVVPGWGWWSQPRSLGRRRCRTSF